MALFGVVWCCGVVKQLFNRPSNGVLFFQVRRTYGHVYRDLSPVSYKVLHAVQIFVNIVILTFCTMSFPLLRFDLSIQFWR